MIQASRTASHMQQSNKHCASTRTTWSTIWLRHGTAFNNDPMTLGRQPRFVNRIDERVSIPDCSVKDDRVTVISKYRCVKYQLHWPVRSNTRWVYRKADVNSLITAITRITDSFFREIIPSPISCNKNFFVAKDFHKFWKRKCYRKSSKAVLSGNFLFHHFLKPRTYGTEDVSWRHQFTPSVS